MGKRFNRFNKYAFKLQLGVSSIKKDLPSVICEGSRGLYLRDIVSFDRRHLQQQIQIISSAVALVRSSRFLRRFLVLAVSKSIAREAEHVFADDRGVEVCMLDSAGTLRACSHYDKPHYPRWSVKSQLVCVVVIGFSEELVRYQHVVNRLFCESAFPCVVVAAARPTSLDSDYTLAAGVDSSLQVRFWLRFLKRLFNSGDVA